MHTCLHGAFYITYHRANKHYIYWDKVAKTTI